LLATVLGSAMASIDATVVGIALPAIGRDFGASLTVLQWVVTAYTLTLAGLLLFAGTLGDGYGRKRISWPASYGSRWPRSCADSPRPRRS
jgi:MFS family permease